MRNRSLRSWKPAVFGLLGGAGLWLATGPARAHYAPGDCNDGFGYCFNVNTGEYEYFDAKDPCKGGHKSGDPVDSFSGAFVHEVTDLRVPGRGLDVEIRRTYRSSGQYNGPFGYNWSFNYSMRAIRLDSGSYLVRSGGGQELVFRSSGNNSLGEPTYCGCEFFRRMVEHLNGSLTLIEKDGRRLEFNPEGTLRAVGDRFGNEIQFEYAETAGLPVRQAIKGKSKYFLRTGSGIVARDYQIVKIIDTYGRELTLSYYTSADGFKQGRVREIADQEGRTVRYDYDDNGNLTSVIGPASDEFPAGTETEYAYASGQANEALNHNLTSITDGRGREYLTTVYDANDRVQSQTFGGGTTTWSYDTVNRRTTVTDGRGNVSVLTFNTSGQPTDVKQYTRGLRPSEPPFYQSTFQYNSDQDLTRMVAPNGSAVEYTYSTDGAGNVLEVRREPAGGDPGGADDIVESFTWEPIYNQLRTSTDARGFVSTRTYDYQEGNDIAGLAARLGVSTAEISSRLASAGIPMSLGDVNGDGRVDQIGGVAVRVRFPDVTVESSPQIVETLDAFNDRGQRVSTSSPEGRVVEYDYHPASDPDGDGVPVLGQSGSEPSGYLKTVTTAPGTPDETVTTAVYDAFGNIHTVTDGNGKTTTLEYDERNLPVRMVAPAPFGYQVEMHYDAASNLERVEVENKDRNNVQVGANPWFTTTYTYDDMNRLLTRQAEIAPGQNALESYAWDPNGNLVQVTRPEGNALRLEYDERDLLLRARRGYGTAQEAVTTFNYDANGNRTEVIDANTHSTLASYDGFDRLIGTTNPIGATVQLDYDKAGNLLGVTSRDNAALELAGWTRAYDELGREVQIDRQLLDATGAIVDVVTTLLVHDRDGLLKKMTDDNGNRSFLEYDAAGRLIESRDELDNATLYTRDDAGNVLTRTSRNRDDQTAAILDIPTTYGYDALNRITSVTDALGRISTVAYDSRSNLAYSTDRAGNTLSQVFDGLTRLISTVQDVRDAGGTVVGTVTRSLSYDRNNRLVDETDTNGTRTHYAYDALNRLASQTWGYQTPSAQTETYTYDGVDNRLTRLDANGTTTTYGYDNANRMTSATGGGLTETYQYDGLNRLTQAVLQSGMTTESTVTRTYDSLNRLLTETQNALTVAREYDGVGNRTELTWPGSGYAVTEVHNELNQLAQVKDPSNAVIAGYNYLGPSLVTRRTYGNGRKLVRSYDALGRVVSHQHQDGFGVLMRGFGYGYDRLGNRLFEERLHDAGVGEVYRYDSLYRLARGWDGASASDIFNIKNALAGGTPPPDPVTYTAQTTYSLDGVGNRTLVDRNGTPVSYTPNVLNQYDAVAGVTQVHDDNGNLTDDGTRLFAYDRENRATEVRRKSDNALLVTYVYDALGRRIEKRFPDSSRVVFVYEGNRVIEERDGANAVLARYVYGAGVDEVLLMRRGGVDSFLHEDGLGSIIAATNGAGALVEQYRYDEFGAVSFLDGAGSGLTASAIGNPWLYSGRQHDPETGLFHYRRRTYDPSNGRFLSKDPFGYLDGYNLYAYVNNNPVNFVDPFGLESTKPGSNRPPTALEAGGGAALGALKGFLNIFAEAGKQVYDMGGGLVDVVGAKTGFYDYRHDYVSAIGTAAEHGAGTGDIFVGMGKGIIETPGRLMDAAERGDSEAFGAEALNLYMLGRSAQQMGQAGIRGFNNLRAARAGGSSTGAASATAPTGNPGTTFSGHGGYPSGAGITRVPQGTYVSTFSEFGTPITDSLGNLIETGAVPKGTPLKVYGPGDPIPNMNLYPPDGLNIAGNPLTVAKPTPLSDLLKPNMGNCNWAACQSRVPYPGPPPLPPIPQLPPPSSSDPCAGK